VYAIFASPLSTPGHRCRSTLGGAVASIRRILRLVASGVVALLGLWYRAVLAAPEVKRRKAARRRRRLS
jgi:hypothetical protein